MKEKIKESDTIKDRAETKYLEIETKIPEIFILATSVLMLFLSTISEEGRDIYYWLSFSCFSGVIAISLIILFGVKSLYKNIWLLFEKISSL